MQATKTETGYQLGKIQVDIKPYSLLPVQQAITLLFVAEGLPQKDIAKTLGVKVSTIKQACSNLGFKFNTCTMRETVNVALQQGVLRYTLCVMLCVLSATNADVERSFRTARHNRTTRITKTARTRRLRELSNNLLMA